MTEERASNSTPNDAPPEEDPRPDGLRSAKSLLLVNTGALVCGHGPGLASGHHSQLSAAVGTSAEQRFQV